MKRAIPENTQHADRGRRVVRTAARVLAICTLAGLVAGTATAESGWAVRGAVFALSTNAAPVSTRAGASLELSDGSGFELGVQYRLQSRVSIEIASLVGDLESDYRIVTGGTALRVNRDVATEIFTVGANYHLTPDRRLRVTLGGFGALSYYDGAIVNFPAAGFRENVAFDDDLGFGAKLGLDWQLTEDSPWSVSGSLRYLSTLVEAETGQDISLDPIIVSIGIGYGF